MANGVTKNGYVTIKTFEDKLWNIKGDFDKSMDKNEKECKEANIRIYDEALDMKKNILNNNNMSATQIKRI